LVVLFPMVYIERRIPGVYPRTELIQNDVTLVAGKPALLIERLRPDLSPPPC
jgi:hypothetical protein